MTLGQYIADEMERNSNLDAIGCLDGSYVFTWARSYSDAGGLIGTGLFDPALNEFFPHLSPEKPFFIIADCRI